MLDLRRLAVGIDAVARGEERATPKRVARWFSGEPTASGRVVAEREAAMTEGTDEGPPPSLAEMGVVPREAALSPMLWYDSCVVCVSRVSFHAKSR